MVGKITSSVRPWIPQHPNEEAMIVVRDRINLLRANIRQDAARMDASMVSALHVRIDRLNQSMLKLKMSNIGDNDA
jgi:hypothetical protein